MNYHKKDLSHVLARLLFLIMIPLILLNPQVKENFHFQVEGLDL